MINVHSSMMYVAAVVTSLIFFVIPSASAHVVSQFSIQPDPNYIDPVTHYLSTKEGHPIIIIKQDSEFTLPMTLKSANDSLSTYYSILITNDTNFTTKVILPEILIRVVPDHFVIHHGGDQKFDIVIRVGKNAPSGIYKPNLAIKWNNNITRSMDITSISFQVGKWNWDSLERQMESGISSNHVVCKSNLQIVIIKSEDGSPACVKPDTATILIERGWSKPLQ
ncbi:MAG: hypothetical protein KGI02_08880 [Thaumarchaeota archaeon]|nr:hypothetical protein [Nitrososphaerota archaeon]MDE1841942.1 hypothetical protein [Nitrososphaerota archaeon]MDE1878652.1 hypothetical protein [Nitrososphaerota archaeon]